MNKLRFVLLAFLLAASSLYSHALEKQANKPKAGSKVITIETATIRGNQELPTVLYLVPWQAPEINSLNATQTADLTKNTIELIDRNSFKRLIEYHEGFESP
tara:strand:+ start:2731 stop:3036 length:306 start_codon:yes stop_codon:yes gene_type:complete